MVFLSAYKGLMKSVSYKVKKDVKDSTFFGYVRCLMQINTHDLYYIF